MLSIHSLTVNYGNLVALQDLDLELAPGITAVLGANGAGKSSLMNCIAGLAKPTSGMITMTSRDGTVEDLRRIVSYLPQDFAYPPRFSIEEYIRYGLWIRRAKQINICAEIVDCLGLGPYLRRRLGTLSGGTLQRAGIALAMHGNPVVLVLDEPTTGLDPGQRQQFRELLLQGMDNRITVLSTHIVEDISLTADRVIVLNKGQVRFDGNVGELRGLGESRGNMTQLESGYLRAVAES